MQLTLYVAMFLLGLVAIMKGADWLTDGAAAVARRLGVPSIVVGLTIVAVGSSMPEFVVSVFSSIKGNAGMAIGNVLGSNIFNLLGILGITALILPIQMHHGNVRNDVPFAVLSSLVLCIVAWDGVVGRSEALLMLSLFMVFMSYTLALAHSQEPDADAEAPVSMAKAIGLCVLGLAFLLVGGEVLVDGGVGAARLMGMSEALVALTFVSIGTSLPELAASVVAARKGDHGMALGNVVGSVVFNVFFVLGTAGTINPLPVEGVSTLSFAALLACSILLWIFCRFGQKTYVLTRAEGAVLVAALVGYYIWLIVGA